MHMLFVPRIMIEKQAAAREYGVDRIVDRDVFMGCFVAFGLGEGCVAGIAWFQK